jgi:hypothetical protein
MGWCRRKTTVKENGEALLVASYMFSPEVNVEKTKYIFLFSQQTSRQTHKVFRFGKVQIFGVTDKTKN